MPSAEETTYLIEVVPNTTQDFLSSDVDLLVSQIKENLRLSSLKAKSSISGLIKEAVKRLQANLVDLDNSEEEEEDEQSSTGYQRKPYFYDSEDEQLPPVYESLEL
ncbi:hypothetical protein WN51_12239 [Melipona quadrifasciata]|uniref:Uncharacterized protein n=1 Tax=Melipona quadrifasciata TaxID=166423 RepID=A0A0M9A1M7_9HYME|nr:hypothetical protein WN51_12239 [Melipona quadrifasciata]